MSHIFKRCLLSGICPELWKEFKIIPPSKDGNGAFTGSNGLMILEGIIFKHILNSFSRNGLLASAQHAHIPGHPISTTLAKVISGNPTGRTELIDHVAAMVAGGTASSRKNIENLFLPQLRSK